MILLHVYNITSILVMKNDENHEMIKLGKSRIICNQEKWNWTSKVISHMQIVKR